MRARLLASAPPWLAGLSRLAPRLPAQIAGGISLLCFVIWAVTGGGYFWPAWVWLSFALLLALAIGWRWSRLAPPGARRDLETQVAFSAVLTAYAFLVWAISGGGYFWPVWPLIGFTVAFVVHLAYLRRRGADLRPTRERELTERVETLTETRRGALDVQAAELRRIERDLHDGAQARLVALSMQLGRAEEGLASNMNVRENIYLNPAASGKGVMEFVPRAAELRQAEATVRRFSIKTAGVEAPVATLSGGNQQKVVLARWMETQVKLLILEEPTIGVDVGAKADIYHLLQLSLRRGLAVLLISSDFEEVERICHRALVFSRGQVAAEIPGHALTIAALTSAASGGTWTAPLGAQS